MPELLGYYDRDGNGVSLDRWCWLIEQGPVYRVVDQAWWEVPDTDSEIFLSAVWLGLDHSLGLYVGPPLIFEVAVFAESTVDALGEEDVMERYATEVEVRARFEQLRETIASVHGPPSRRFDREEANREWHARKGS